ncbi:hypothetical protein BT96DRAFT_941493 [Gymnopus androsaceus JB14]|uniref:Uncharacterized protein n=1 Tax=Gymnopus androsaceus JB14 TaxID=1447944 RepID=A0A6A4HGH8_9AGAR|nr:hypothetical protein BT96DRAFT_941493 [Gymnopus androsaceus JB14]
MSPFYNKAEIELDAASDSKVSKDNLFVYLKAGVSAGCNARPNTGKDESFPGRQLPGRFHLQRWRIVQQERVGLVVVLVPGGELTEYGTSMTEQAWTRCQSLTLGRPEPISAHLWRRANTISYATFASILAEKLLQTRVNKGTCIKKEDGRHCACALRRRLETEGTSAAGNCLTERKILSRKERQPSLSEDRKELLAPANLYDWDN